MAVWALLPALAMGAGCGPSTCSVLLTRRAWKPWRKSPLMGTDALLLELEARKSFGSGSSRGKSPTSISAAAHGGLAVTMSPWLGDGETEAAARRERGWQLRGQLGEGGWFVGLEGLPSRSRGAEISPQAPLSSLQPIPCGGSVFPSPP